MPVRSWPWRARTRGPRARYWTSSSTAWPAWRTGRASLMARATAQGFSPTFRARSGPVSSAPRGSTMGSRRVAASRSDTSSFPMTLSAPRFSTRSRGSASRSCCRVTTRPMRARSDRAAASKPRGSSGSRALYEAALAIERTTAATVVSLSRHTAVYKLRGSGHQLTSYFEDLGDPRFATSVAFGHNRYATNTTTSFTRVQPFPVFAHNGEINTISRLREEARGLGLVLSRDGSDSQDVDAVIRGLVMRHRLTPIEAVELLFPPIVNEMKRMSGELQDAYVEGRAALGPLAQGPAAILSRVGDTCIFGVDALGLRPLWHVETEDEHVFASERGFVPLERYIADPYPLGPGERVALRRDRGWRLLDQKAVREQFVGARRARGLMLDGLRERIVCGGPAEAVHAGRRWEIGVAPDEVEDVAVRRERQFAALGFEPDDLKQAAYMAETGNEPIGSLGYDGPLAALAPRANLADHLHETVAVVTNPAIDREREIEHFSTRVLLGPRPSPGSRGAPPRLWIELATPIVLGGHS